MLFTRPQEFVQHKIYTSINSNRSKMVSETDRPIRVSNKRTNPLQNTDMCLDDYLKSLKKR